MLVVEQVLSARPGFQGLRSTGTAGRNPAVPLFGNPLLPFNLFETRVNAPIVPLDYRRVHGIESTRKESAAPSLLYYNAAAIRGRFTSSRIVATPISLACGAHSSSRHVVHADAATGAARAPRGEIAATSAATTSIASSATTITAPVGRSNTDEHTSPTT